MHTLDMIAHPAADRLDRAATWLRAGSAVHAAFPVEETARRTRPARRMVVRAKWLARGAARGLAHALRVRGPVPELRVARTPA